MDSVITTVCKNKQFKAIVRCRKKNFQGKINSLQLRLSNHALHFTAKGPHWRHPSDLREGGESLAIAVDLKPLGVACLDFNHQSDTKL